MKNRDGRLVLKLILLPAYQRLDNSWTPSFPKTLWRTVFWWGGKVGWQRAIYKSSLAIQGHWSLLMSFWPSTPRSSQFSQICLPQGLPNGAKIGKVNGALHYVWNRVGVIWCLPCIVSFLKAVFYLFCVVFLIIKTESLLRYACNYMGVGNL